MQDSLARANEVAEETCSSMRTVRSFANEPVETARYAEKLVVTRKLKVKEAFAYAGYVWSNEVRNAACCNVSVSFTDIMFWFCV